MSLGVPQHSKLDPDRSLPAIDAAITCFGGIRGVTRRSSSQNPLSEALRFQIGIAILPVPSPVSRGRELERLEAVHGHDPAR